MFRSSIIWRKFLWTIWPCSLLPFCCSSTQLQLRYLMGRLGSARPLNFGSTAELTSSAKLETNFSWGCPSKFFLNCLSQTNNTNIGVIDFSEKPNFGGSHGIISGQKQFQLESAICEKRKKARRTGRSSYMKINDVSITETADWNDADFYGYEYYWEDSRMSIAVSKNGLYGSCRHW